jgi:hypothetical protein
LGDLNPGDVIVWVKRHERHQYVVAEPTLTRNAAKLRVIAPNGKVNAWHEIPDAAYVVKMGEDDREMMLRLAQLR